MRAYRTTVRVRSASPPTSEALDALVRSLRNFSPSSQRMEDELAVTVTVPAADALEAVARIRVVLSELVAQRLDAPRIVAVWAEER